MPSLPGSPHARRLRGRRKLRPHLEVLEAHLLPATMGVAGAMIPAIIMQPLLQVGVGVGSDPDQIADEGTPWGLAPHQVRTAYAFPDAAAGTGTGWTVRTPIFPRATWPGSIGSMGCRTRRAS
jgi:hypothetical protein